MVGDSFENARECLEANINAIKKELLLKIDLSNPNERLEAKKTGLFQRVCNNAVEQTAEILENYL